MELTFNISRWTAWAPGLSSTEEWLAWSRSPTPVVGPEMPALTELPAMARRRVDKLGRFVTHVALSLQGDSRGTPIVFASRHGDSTRAFDTQLEVAREAPVSPMAFALSVHNAIGGQYSVLRGETANVVAIANGLFTLEAGLIEALTLGESAILVAYDNAPHPALAARFPDVPADFAFAWHVQRGGPWKLRTCGATPSRTAPVPHALDVFGFILRGDAMLRAGDGVSGYEWEYAPAVAAQRRAA